MKCGLEANFIGILPKSFDDLRGRILSRNKESDEVVNKRLDIAKIEIEEISKSDFFNFLIINENLDTAYDEFKKAFFSLYVDLNKY